MRTLLHEIQPTVVLQDENSGKREFHLDSCIGRGASCLVYHAVCADNTEHLLKEYYPKHLNLVRGTDGAVLVPPEKQQKFENGLARFRNACERQKAVRLNEDLKNCTCNIQGYYVGNGTVYLDTTCFAGRTYSQVREKTLYDLARRMKALARVLGYYHQKNLLHLDIKPDNILVRPEEETVEDVMLFDFDSVTDLETAKEGKGLSYTQEWAAPEQKLPRRYKEIGRGSDIYAVGEIIFVQLFGRHSELSERRSFSSYVFDYKADIFQNVNPRVFPLLETLLKKTICGRVENRYQTTDELVEQLEAIIKLADPKVPFIGKNLPPVQDFFVGREDELEEMHRLLGENRLLFLCGVGGIGKSELAKQYATQYQDSYDSILFAPYLNDVSALMQDDDAIHIQNFGPYPDEKTEEYQARKLQKLKALCDQRTLLIVDNLNRIDDPDLKKLLALDCRLLITTRADFSGFGHGKQLPVETLKCGEDIERIFYHHYQGELNQEDRAIIREIITLVEGHTMTVELIAKQIDAQWTTPGEILEKMKGAGIHGIGDEEVDSGKDGSFSSRSTYEHIKALFDLAVFETAGKENELYLLYNLSLMPYTGIDRRLFAQWCQLEKHGGKGIVKHLIKSGWVRKSERNLSLHPVVAEVVLARLKENPQAELPVLRSSVEYIQTEEYGKADASEQLETARMMLAISKNVARMHRNTEEIANFLSEVIRRHGFRWTPRDQIFCLENLLRVREKLPENNNCENAVLSNIIEYKWYEEAENCRYWADHYDEMCEEVSEQIYQEAVRCQSKVEYYYQKAVRNFLAALIQYKALYGEISLQTAELCIKLGDFYAQNQEFDLALKYYQQAIEIQQQLDPKDHRVALLYSCLGKMYENNGNNTSAEECYLKELDYWLQSNAYTEIIQVYDHLGTFYEKQLKYTQAEGCYLKELEYCSQAEAYCDMVRICKYMGGFYAEQKQYGQAKKYYEKSFKVILRHIKKVEYDQAKEVCHWLLDFYWGCYMKSNPRRRYKHYRKYVKTDAVLTFLLHSRYKETLQMMKNKTNTADDVP